MALITTFTRLQKDRNRVHGVVECGYTVFEEQGARYLQFDTFGSPDRQIPGTTSQSVQLNQVGGGAERPDRENVPVRRRTLTAGAYQPGCAAK